MEYREFIEAIKDIIENELSKNIEISVREVVKNNGVIRNGIVFVEAGINASPTIYLEYYYEMFKKGENIDDIALEIIENYYKNKLTETVDIDDFLEFEKIKDRLFCKLINKEMNEDYLDSIPHEDYLDLSVVVYYLMKDFEFGEASITVNYSHLDMWHVSKEEVFACAKKNTSEKMRYSMENISKVIGELGIESEDCENLIPELPMYVLTNERRMYGSAFMLFPNILDEFCDVLNDNYVILPSSVHELILLPNDSCDEYESCNEMIKDVNRDHVVREEILSDHAYVYSKRMGCMCV